MGLDELEALRLSDLEGLYQETAAERMGVSRATLGRILARARAAVADALVNGKALVVGPAEVVELPDEVLACPVHSGGRRRGRGCRCRRARWSDEERGAEAGTADPGEPDGGTAQTASPPSASSGVLE
jgi:hypothetical protein